MEISKVTSLVLMETQKHTGLVEWVQTIHAHARLPERVNQMISGVTAI